MASAPVATQQVPPAAAPHPEAAALRRACRVLGLVVLVLVCLGVVMVYSATLTSGAYYLRRQAVWALVGGGCLLVASHTPYRWLLGLDPLVFAGALLLLVMVFVPGAGHDAGTGAFRWLRLGGQVFQPSELARPALVLFIAWYAARRPDALAELRRGFLPVTGAVLAVCLLVFLEPDLGSAVFTATVAMVTLLVAGTRVLHLTACAAALMPAVAAYAWLRFEHVARRLAVFLDPSADATGAAWQINQSLIAQGVGGWFGVGLGRSMQKFGYLPEAHTDFVFAIIGEELGLAGTLLVLGCFGAFLWQGLVVLRRLRDPRALVLGFGLVFMISLQALMNVAVVTASVPTKGIGLPLVSYGGSSLVMTMSAVGVVLGLARSAARDIEQGRDHGQ